MKRLILLLALSLSSLTAAPDLVILVRHAEKAAEPATNPPLSDTGRQRAARLPAILETWTATGAPIRGLFATELLRTQQTLEPLSKTTRLPITTVNAKDTPELVKKIMAINGGIVVVVGHSNTIPEVIEALGGPSGLEIDDPDYTGLYLLTFPGANPAHLIELHY
jgi:broad specificity phosphatase PhoE